MDKSSMVDRKVELGTRLAGKLEKTTPVIAAFLLKSRENGEWSLHVVPEHQDKKSMEAAYIAILRIANELNDTALDPFQIRLVGLSEPTAQAALEIYRGSPPRIPIHLQREEFGGVEVEEVYLIKGPTGESTMASGREVLNHIIDEEATFFQQHGKPPRKIKLPVLMAYDLAKCGREDLGDLSGRVFKDGITVFEKEGFHGMSVEIIRDRNATLMFE
jgi:hypothetical protein